MTEPIRFKEMRRPSKEAVRAEAGWVDLASDVDG